MSSSPAYYATLDERRVRAHVGLHAKSAHRSATRVSAVFVKGEWIAPLGGGREFRVDDGKFVERERIKLKKFAATAPDTPDAFIAWFESLRERGPDRDDDLFPWTAGVATSSPMRWVLRQRRFAEAGSEDVVAMAQVEVNIAALRAIEMTAPRLCLVDARSERRNAPPRARTHFQLHAGLDIRHSQAWNREVIRPIVAANPRVAFPIAEGGLVRLSAGARCFVSYRAFLGFDEGIGQREGRDC